jgi:16S rRNA (cytosine967-C5)-methyltransferase
VAAAKHKVWAKSLVNGILRQYLRDAETLEATCAAYHQTHHNHPEWMMKLIQQAWPEQAEAIFSANDQAPPMSLRVNLHRTSRSDYMASLQAEGIDAERFDACDSAITLPQAVSVESLPDFHDGLVSVQDLAAQLAAQLLDAQANQSVLDMCAAPGGKTAAILERQPDLKSLLAIDVDSHRLERVTQNLQRLQLSAETLAADASQPQNWAKGRQFERILLDAPCSGLGVIRRHPDIKLLRRESDIAALQSLQAQILEAAWSLLTVDGILLYATCSILKQENEQQIEAFLARHANAVEIKIEADWGIARPHGRQIITGQQQMDGFYYAKLHKTA